MFQCLLETSQLRCLGVKDHRSLCRILLLKSVWPGGLVGKDWVVSQFFITGSRTVIPLDMGNCSEKDRRDRSVPSAAAWAGTGPKSDTLTLQAVRLQAGPKDVNTESGPRRPL